MVLPDDQALLAEAGEQIEFEEPGGEVVGLKVADEIGVRIGKREIAFAGRHEGGQMAHGAGKKLEFGRDVARAGLHE